MADTVEWMTVAIPPSRHVWRPSSPSQVTTWGGNNKRNWRDSILNGKLQVQRQLITHIGEKSKKHTLKKSRTIATSKQVATTKIVIGKLPSLSAFITHSLTQSLFNSNTGQWSLQIYIFGEDQKQNPIPKRVATKIPSIKVPGQGQEVVRESQESSLNQVTN